MSTTPAIDTAHLPGADWDLMGFLTNANTYVNNVGAALITLLGLIILLWWALDPLAKTFFFRWDQHPVPRWKLWVPLIPGGAMLAGGGWLLLKDIAKGGKATIEELGGGFIVLQSTLGVLPGVGG